MNITDKNIIGEVVADDYRTASVFKSYGIDFCCNGNRSIGEACENKQLNTNEVVDKLNTAREESAAKGTDYTTWPLDLLADYIEKKHHRYVEQKLVEIKPYLQKIVSVHGDRHPELGQIEELFSQSAGELAKHMKKEELILFPFIRKMVQAKEKGETLKAPQFGSVENPIANMMHEHQDEGERFEKIAALSNNYQLPADGCNTYRVTLALLKEFEDDLHLHIHLENNILFPKAALMEKEMVTTA